jgi:hypothetical protein
MKKYLTKHAGFFIAMTLYTIIFMIAFNIA